MARDFEKGALSSFVTEKPSGQYPSNEDMDHLTYLDNRPSLFEHEEEESIREWRLVCASCGHLATTVSEKIEVRGRHHHDFPYYGHIVRLGCYRNAPGCVGIDGISNSRAFIIRASSTKALASDWSKWTNFRNRLVHAYWDLDKETVYQILQSCAVDFQLFQENTIDFLNKHACG